MEKINEIKIKRKDKRKKENQWKIKKKRNAKRKSK